VLRVDRKDRLSGGLFRQREVDLAVEAPWPPERGVDGVRPVGSPNHNHLPPVCDAIHEAEERGYHRGVDGIGAAATGRGEPIDLVEEDY